MGIQHRLDEPDPVPEREYKGYEKREAQRAAMLVLISQRFNVSVDDVLAKVRVMSTEERVDEWTALEHYKVCAEMGSDPYPYVRARARR
jgi:hypothetical protein